MKRVLLIFVVSAIAAALSAATASAEPVNNPHAITQRFTCDGEQVPLVIRPVHGFSAFVVGDPDVLTAKRGTLVLTNVETGEEQTFTFAKPGKGFEGDLVTCTATYTYGGFLWDVTVQAVDASNSGPRFLGAIDHRIEKFPHPCIQSSRGALGRQRRGLANPRLRTPPTFPYSPV